MYNPNPDGLDEITEAYITQRLHSPRVELSNDFKMALWTEVRKLHKEGINAKRIVAAIDFITQSTVNDKALKQDAQWQQTLAANKKPAPKVSDEIKNAPKFKF